jgi:SAM-dependent methyltransferase
MLKSRRQSIGKIKLPSYLSHFETCPVCRSASKPYTSMPGACAIRLCPECGVHFALHAARTSAAGRKNEDHFRNLDCSKYERSVRALREASYAGLLERVARFARAGAWLDVGCSYGWLLERVRHAGFSPYGVEPSPSAAATARQAGLAVETGVFPEDVGNGYPYAVVSFIDVLEHLREPCEALLRTRPLLTADGIVLIQVPDQACLLYKIATAMCRWTGGRFDFALRRLWLVDLDFPHLLYFELHSLHRLLANAGYEVLDCWRSAIGSPGSARDRVEYLQNKGRVPILLVSFAVALMQRIDTWLGQGGLLTVMARPHPGREQAG